MALATADVVAGAVQQVWTDDKIAERTAQEFTFMPDLGYAIPVEADVPEGASPAVVVRAIDQAIEAAVVELAATFGADCQAYTLEHVAGYSYRLVPVAGVPAIEVRYAA